MRRRRVKEVQEWIYSWNAFLEKSPWRSLIEEVIGLKQDSFMGVTVWSSFFWCFLDSYIKDYLEFFETPTPPHSNYTFTPP